MRNRSSGLNVSKTWLSLIKETIIVVATGGIPLSQWQSRDIHLKRAEVRCEVDVD